MKPSTKKITVIALSIFIAALAVGIVSYCIFRYFISSSLNEETAYSTYDTEIKILNESYPSDIIVYGEDVGFDSGLKFRTINEIKEEHFTQDSNYKYTFFVINDRGGTAKITDEEFELIKRVCDEKNINFFYIGKQYLEHLKDFGFYDQLYSTDPCGCAYIISPYGRTGIDGVWTSTEEMVYANNPRLLGEILACTFVGNVIRSMN